MIKNLVVIVNDKQPMRRTYQATNAKEAERVLEWLTNNGINAELHALDSWQAKYGSTRGNSNG